MLKKNNNKNGSTNKAPLTNQGLSPQASARAPSKVTARPAPEKRGSSNNRGPGGLEIATNRMSYYKEGASKLYLAAGIAIVALGAQAFVAFMGYTAKNERVYFATDANGSLIELVRLGQPNQSREAVAQWVQHAIVDTFSFNFTNINDRLNASTMRWFTTAGASSFLNEINNSGYMEAVRNEKLILNLTLEHTPILVNQGPHPATGIYTWIFQSDAIVTFRTQSRQFTRNVRMTTTVDRVSVLESKDGLGISNIVLVNR